MGEGGNTVTYISNKQAEMVPKSQRHSKSQQIKFNSRDAIANIDIISLAVWKLQIYLYMCSSHKYNNKLN